VRCIAVLYSKPFENSIAPHTTEYRYIDIACQLWADSIIAGIQVAPQQDINFDLIICSQWQRLKTESPGREITIATHNIRHLRRFAQAELWENL